MEARAAQPSAGAAGAAGAASAGGAAGACEEDIVGQLVYHSRQLVHVKSQDRRRLTGAAAGASAGAAGAAG